MDEGLNNWYEAMRRGVQLSGTTVCDTLEILQYPSLAKPQWNEGTVDDSTLPEWLSAEPSMPSATSTQIREEPTGGLRLLIATSYWNDDEKLINLPFKRDSFSLVQKSLALPEYFLKIVTSYHTRGVKFSAYRQSSLSFPVGFLLKIPYYREDFFQIALQYDVKMNLMHGIAIVRGGLKTIPFIRSLIDSFEQHCSQPLLLPVLLVEPLVSDRYKRMNSHHQKLDDMEALTGQHEYSRVPSGNPLELDFVSTTRGINFIGNGVGIDVLGLKCVLSILEQLVEWGHALKEARIGDHKAEIPSDNTRYEGEAIIMEKIAYLKDTCNVLLVEAEYEEKRVRALIQVVYQFMAAKDAKTNLNLAESSAIMAKASKEDSAIMKTIAIESKKDSSAMKTIAILGMFFLPGTFVAAIFAMPVFNWDGNGTPAVKKGFGYYWAVAVPLTILVLATWTMGMLLPWKAWISNLQGSSHRLEQDVEDKTAGQ